MVWDTDYYGGTRTVDIHIMHVREKISNASVGIVTVRGVGYKLVERRENGVISNGDLNKSGVEQMGA